MQTKDKREAGFTDAEKREFYKSLITKNFSEAAAGIGLDKRYTNASSLRAKAYQLYKSIVPEELGIDKEIVEMVQKSIEARKSAPNRHITEVGGILDNTDLIDPQDTKQVIVGGRNKAAMLLHKKMDRLSKNKKLLDNVTLTQLATTFGIFFDKAQILQGQATENIQVLAKISDNLSAEESLDMLLKMREKEQLRD